MHLRTLLPFLVVFAFVRLAAAQTTAKTQPSKPIAPSLTPAMLHQRTDDLLQGLMRDLPTVTQSKLVGAYVAFDADLSQPYAMIACDDDGDYVVVVSDAMVEFAQRVAEAASDDELTSSKKLEAYATSLGAASVRGARLLPPPPGFYSGAHDPDHQGELFDQAMRGLLAHELARLARGHLVCARPSAAREAADDVWTPAERAFAWTLSERLYDSQHLADADAATTPWLRGRSKGYLAMLDAFALIEAGTSAQRPSATVTFPQIRLHQNNGARAAALRALSGAAEKPL